MKWIARFVFFSSLLILISYASVTYAEVVNTPDSLIDMIPQKALAYISISDLDDLERLVKDSPEWAELLAMEEIAEDLDQAQQVLSFGPMLFGIKIEEFVNTFGNRMVICLMGMSGPMPVAGLIVDTGEYKEAVEYAVEQAATLPAVAGGVMVEDDEYRGIPCTVIGNRNFEVKYGFVDNYLMAGISGGFEALVNFHKDGGKSIKDTENYQYMEQRVSLSSNICLYADLERAVPIVKQLTGMSSGEGDGPMTPESLANLAFNSAGAFALSLDLLGHTNEVYLYLKQPDPHPISDLVLASRSPMYSANLIPLNDGVMAGVHIGDPMTLMEKGFELAELFGVEPQALEAQIEEIENAVGLSLRDDLLSTLTGEIAVIAMLPKEPIRMTEDKIQMVKQIAAVRPLILVGVKDGERLKETAAKLSKLVELETMPLEEESYNGVEIVTKAVTLDALVPGIAIIPAYATTDNLLIMSNSARWVRDAIDLLKSPGNPEIQDKLSESRMLVYLDAAGMADFVVSQDVIPDIKPPEEVQDKMLGLGSVAASFFLGTDGAGIRLISTSDDVWATKILRGVMIAIHAGVGKESEKEAALERAEWEEQHEEGQEESHESTEPMNEEQHEYDED